MGESLKLYLVECRGMTASYGGRPAHGRAYVVATDPRQAWDRVSADLQERDLGTEWDREMGTITLLAEDVPYPACKYRLYIGGAHA